MDEPTKRCPVCKRDLPRTQFFKAANRKDGLYGYCKECHGRDGKARRDRLMAAGGNPVKRATKYCPKCEQTLPSSDFYVHRSASDGLANKCKACCKIYNDGRYHNVNKLNPSYKAHVKE